jgi:hypothetical protein
MSPKTKFESVQKRDASEFIPGVEWLGLENEIKGKRRRKNKKWGI